MTQSVDIAIIGAGTAGLTARAQVAGQTDSYVVVDGGILGTTCARVGCMPSKAFIEVANTVHKQKSLARYGICNQDGRAMDYQKVMSHVRGLRDRFAGGVVRGMESWKGHFIPKYARFVDAHTLDLGDETIRADKIIIAAGSKPYIPEAWETFKDYLVDTDGFFELETLPRRMAVMGLGPIGIELGQALTRLGVETVAMVRRNAMGGLTDPEIRDYAFHCFSDEMNIQIGTIEIVEQTDEGLVVGCNGRTWTVDKVLVALGRRPVLNGLGMENIGVDLDSRGMPRFDATTQQIEDLPIFIAGDVNGIRPILHEAADEGRIAGYNALADEVTCFEKRVPLHITFSSPNICVVGKSHAQLLADKAAFVTGGTGYERQGRAMIMGENRGKVHIYGSQKDGRLLGAEMIAPAGEHMAHLLAWAIANRMRADEVLVMPFYHPVLEEALRTALRSIAKACDTPKSEFELSRCGDTIVT